MKKILFAIAAVSLFALGACNKSGSNMQKEENRRDSIQREESMDYETEDRLGEPVENVEVDRVERRVED